MRHLPLSFVSTVLAGVLPVAAWACSCLPQLPVDVYADEKVLFRGTVVARHVDRESREIRFAFDVDTVWQGAVVNGLMLATSLDSAACGVDFGEGEQSIVVARDIGGELRASLCDQAVWDAETGEAVPLEDAVMQRPPLTHIVEADCRPHVCGDGSIHPACTSDGHAINYFADPCMLAPVPADVPVFSDVPVSHPNADAIAWAKERRVVAGYPDGTFRPASAVNRAEFTKILLLAAYGEDEVLEADFFDSPGFSDAREGDWFYQYVLFAWQEGIIEGYRDHTFRPGAQINFAEAAKIIVLSLDVPYTRDLGEQWWESYLDALQRRDALPATYRVPDQLVTRADMVEILYRLRELPVLEDQLELTGILQRAERPAPDIAYDYLLKLDGEFRDPLSAFDPNAVVAEVIVVPSGVTAADLESLLGEHVRIGGVMQQGYAEMRVFSAESAGVTE